MKNSEAHTFGFDGSSHDGCDDGCHGGSGVCWQAAAYKPRWTRRLGATGSRLMQEESSKRQLVLHALSREAG